MSMLVGIPFRQECPGPTEEHRMTQPQEPAGMPGEASAGVEWPAPTGPYDDETLARLLHDLDVANDWHSGT